MSESKFKKFMENVETLTEGSGLQMAPVPEDTVLEQAESEDFETPPAPSAATEPMAVPMPEDEDQEEQESRPEPQQERAAASPATGPKPQQERPDSPSEPRSASQPNQGTLAPQGQSVPQNTPRPAATPEALIQTGVSFLSGLVQTLSNPEQTQALVQSLVAKDEQTGQTYLKIPVESATVVENAVKLLGGLFAQFGR